MQNPLAIRPASVSPGDSGGSGGGRRFFENVPIEMIMDAFEESFSMLPRRVDPESVVDLRDLVTVFKRVHQWTRDTLISGEFMYVIRFMVDQIHNLFVWEYNIVGPEIPVRFNVNSSTLIKDDEFIVLSKDMTVKNCMIVIYHALQGAQKNIDEFNRLALRGQKPEIPGIPESCFEHVMNHIFAVMVDEYRDKTGVEGTAHDFRHHPFPSWVISDGFRKAGSFRIGVGASVVFDVFEAQHSGWVQVRLIADLGLGIRIVVAEDEMAFFNDTPGSEIPEIVSKFFGQAAANIRHWNWLLNGGHKAMSHTRAAHNTQWFRRGQQNQSSPWG